MVTIHYLTEGREQSFSYPLEDWLRLVCIEEDKKLLEVNLIFCSDNELLKKNIEILNHDYFTDIITLDYCLDDQVIGDLFVSVDRVKDNAQKENQTFENERDRVIVHGVLHLCGYGDKDIEQKQVMRAKEDFYLSLRTK